MNKRTTATICRAIQNQCNLRFLYKGKIRFVTPWVYGVKKDAYRLLGYQIAGGNHVGTALFKLEEMRNIQFLKPTRVKPYITPVNAKSDSWRQVVCEVE